MLIISLIGYQSREVVVGSQTNFQLDAYLAIAISQ